MKRTIKLIIYYFAYQLLFTVLVMFVAAIVKAFKAGTLEAVVTGQGSLATDPVVLSLGVLLAALMMLWHLFHFGYIKWTSAYWTKKNVPILLLCIPFIYTLSWLSNMASEVIDLPNLLEDSFIDMSQSVWGILSIAIVAPVLEECLFRGAIEGHLLKLWGRPWLAILVSAFVFGLVHMNPAQSAFAFVIGLVLGWLYWRSGSVIPSIIGHILNNSLAVVQMRLYGAEGSFEELAGEGSMPYFTAAYAVVLILCFVALYKKFDTRCNLFGKSYRLMAETNLSDYEKESDNDNASGSDVLPECERQDADHNV